MIWQLWIFMDFPSIKAIQGAPNPASWRLGALQTMGTTGTNNGTLQTMGVISGRLFWWCRRFKKKQNITKPAWFCSCGRRSKDSKVQTTFGTQPYNIPFRETQWLDESSYFLLGWCFFSPVAAIGITILNTHETTNNVHPLAYPVTFIQYPMFELEDVPLLMAGRLVVSTSIAGWYSPQA